MTEESLWASLISLHPAKAWLTFWYSSFRLAPLLCISLICAAYLVIRLIISLVRSRSLSDSLTRPDFSTNHSSRLFHLPRILASISFAFTSVSILGMERSYSTTFRNITSKTFESTCFIWFSMIPEFLCRVFTKVRRYSIKRSLNRRNSLDFIISSARIPFKSLI